MCVHHTKDYWRGLLRLEFEACGAISGWIGKSGSGSVLSMLRRGREQARSRRAAETPEQ